MLLIGPGESGKSTLLKQMRIIQNREEHHQTAPTAFSSTELLYARDAIRMNALTQMKVLVGITKQYGVPLQGEDSAAAAEQLLRHDVDYNSPEIGALLKILWSEPAIRCIYNERDQQCWKQWTFLNALYKEG